MRTPIPGWRIAVRLLWIGQVFGAFGQSVFLLALYWFVQSSTNSTAMTGTVGMVLFLPALISPLAGVVADRIDRVRLMLIADAARTLPILILVALQATGHSVTSRDMILVGIGLSLGAQFFGPARFAVLPELVSNERLTSANGIFFVGEQAGALVGSVLGGIVVATLGMASTLQISAAILMVSISSLISMWLITKRYSSQQAAATVESMPRLGWWIGIKVVASNRWLMALVAATGMLYLAFAPLIVLMPAWTRDRLGSGADGYGFLEAALPIGMAVGGALAGSMAHRFGKLPVLVTGVIGAGIAIVTLSLQVTLAGTAVGLILAGAPLAAGQVTLTTLVQESADDQSRGRVFGVLNMVTALSMPLGMALSGYGAQVLGVQRLWQLAGAIFCMTGLAVWWLRARSFAKPG